MSFALVVFNGRPASLGRGCDMGSYMRGCTERSSRAAIVAAVLAVAVLVPAPVMAKADQVPAARVKPAEVVIYRDGMGVPHIFATTAPEVFYGASYAIAHDRLAQAEIDTRRQLGRMAEIMGPRSVAADKLARLSVQSDAEVKAQFYALAPEDRAIFRAMHMGWTAYVREVRKDPAKLPYEFKQWGIAPTEWSFWQFLDTLCGIVRNYGSGGGGQELTNLAFYHDVKARFGDKKAKAIFDDVIPLQDDSAIPIIPPGEERTQLDAPQPPRPETFNLQAALPLGQLTLTAMLPRAAGASRALLIGAKKSASGNPLILQATADGPDVHLSGGGYEAAGYVYASMSPIRQGRTPSYAWSATTGEADVVDIFAEKLNPANSRQYFYKGAWRDMDVRQEVILVKGGKPVTVFVERTVHGPIVQREDGQHVAYARSNAVVGRELAGIVGNLHLSKGKTLEDFRRASLAVTASTNYNYAGVDGHIAFVHVGLLPLRAPGLDPRLPTPGTGEYDWNGFVSKDKLPYMLDPEQGYFHAWNNKPTVATTYGDTSRYGKGFRTWLGRSLVEARDKISRADLNEIHRKIGQSFGGVDLSVTNPRFFTPYLRRAVAGDIKLEAVVSAMDNWNAIYEDLDRDGYYDSVGLAIYREWVVTAQKAIIGSIIGDWWRSIDERNYIKYRTDVLLRAIEGNDAATPMKHDWFGGQDRAAVLRKTLVDTVDALAQKYRSDDLRTWRQEVFYRYYKPESQSNIRARPTLRRGEGSSAAGDLGLQPAAIPDNGSEEWNMLVELKKGDPVLYDSTPSGGQNLFIRADGKGNPHIADQIELHRKFQFKAVSLDHEQVKRQAKSKHTIFYPGSVED